MKSKYTVDFFIEKFSKIPEEKWCIGNYHNAITGQYCAMGHTGVTSQKNTREGKALVKIFTKDGEDLDVVDINDGIEASMDDTSYLGATPQERILVALTNIKYLNEN